MPRGSSSSPCPSWRGSCFPFSRRQTSFRERQEEAQQCRSFSRSVNQIHQSLGECPELLGNGASPRTAGCLPPWPWPDFPMPWVGTDWGCPFHHGSLQCVPLALQTDQWSELTKALQEQVEVKKVLWTGGMGTRHVCEVKAPSERAWHGLLTGPFAFPAAQEQAPAPPGETGMPARAKSFVSGNEPLTETCGSGTGGAEQLRLGSTPAPCWPPPGGSPCRPRSLLTAQNPMVSVAGGRRCRQNHQRSRCCRRWWPCSW